MSDLNTPFNPSHLGLTKERFVPSPQDKKVTLHHPVSLINSLRHCIRCKKLVTSCKKGSFVPIKTIDCAVPDSHRLLTAASQVQSVWRLRWIKRHWSRFLPNVCFPCQFSFHQKFYCPRLSSGAGTTAQGTRSHST